MLLFTELVEMQSTDPGGVFPTNPTTGVHSTPTIPNVTSPNSNNHSSSNVNASSPTSHTPPKGPWGRFQRWTEKWRGSRQLVLVIVAIALLLDNMLLTVVGKSNSHCCRAPYLHTKD